MSALSQHGPLAAWTATPDTYFAYSSGTKFKKIGLLKTVYIVAGKNNGGYKYDGIAD